MENKRLRHAVKALHRRLTCITVAVSDKLPEAIARGTDGNDGVRVNIATSIAITTAPTSSSSISPIPVVSTKRARANTTSCRSPANDLCEVCAEVPPRKKELLFSGCLHGMCRTCMMAHLKARRRCCRVCQMDFQGRLQQLGVEVSIKHVLAESEKKVK